MKTEKGDYAVETIQQFKKSGGLAELKKLFKQSRLKITWQLRPEGYSSSPSVLLSVKTILETGELAQAAQLSDCARLRVLISAGQTLFIATKWAKHIISQLEKLEEKRHLDTIAGAGIDNSQLRLLARLRHSGVEKEVESEMLEQGFSVGFFKTKNPDHRSLIFVVVRGESGFKICEDIPLDTPLVNRLIDKGKAKKYLISKIFDSVLYERSLNRGRI